MWAFHGTVISLSIKAAELHWGDSCFQYFTKWLNNMYFEWTLECKHYASSFHFDGYRIKKYSIASKRLKNVYGIEQNIFKVKIWFYQSMSVLLRQVTKHTCDLFKWLKYYFRNTPRCTHSAYGDICTLGEGCGHFVERYMRKLRDGRAKSNMVYSSVSRGDNLSTTVSTAQLIYLRDAWHTTLAHVMMQCWFLSLTPSDS